MDIKGSEWTLDTLKDVGLRDGLWIFGYGSLIWRPNFAFTSHYHGCVQGYVRRFWQLSPDHRGTEERTGRVCTLAPAVPFILLPDEEPSVHGILYHVSPADVEIELEKLFVREQAGYSVLEVMVECDDGIVRKAFTFTANEDNKYWAGPLRTASSTAAQCDRYKDDFDAAAETIFTAVGPSGTNMEYFMRLYSTLQLHGVTDVYLEQLYSAIETRSK